MAADSPTKPDDRTPADQLTAIGRSLYGDNWERELTMELGVRGKSIRQWLSGHLRLGPDHSLWDTLAALLERREAELRGTREELQEWLQRNRKP